MNTATKEIASWVKLINAGGYERVNWNNINEGRFPSLTGALSPRTEIVEIPNTMKGKEVVAYMQARRKKMAPIQDLINWGANTPRDKRNGGLKTLVTDANGTLCSVTIDEHGSESWIEVDDREMSYGRGWRFLTIPENQ
ncbi:MAG: hypothetical protein Q7R72_00170 [bacterium]|nr:hypothetical protein [bacterium]